MDRDGTKKGYDLDLTKKVSNLVNIPVIASGGVGNLEHLHQGFKIGKASAFLAASVFHFGEFCLQDAKKYLDSNENGTEYNLYKYSHNPIFALL
jgi:cyclase